WRQEMSQWASAAWAWIRDVAIPQVGKWLGNLWVEFRRCGPDHLPNWVNVLLDWAEAAWTWIRDVAIPTATTWMGDLVSTITGFFSGPNFQTWKSRIVGWWNIAKEFFTVTVPEWLRTLEE